MTFYVGQKVVLVDSSGWEKIPERFSYPKHGVVYSIRECIGINIRLNEIKNPDGMSEENFEWTEPYFRASRFRPLTDTRKSVSFTTGAPKDSESWDNRRKVKERT